jgi:hypothetical protein
MLKPFLKYRKKELVLIILFVSFVTVKAQYDEPVMNEKEIKALEKEKRKAERLEQEENDKKMVEYMMDNKKFVLEANYLSGNSGSRIPVNSTLNFIVIDSARAIIQLANNWSSGYNGLGGITVDGRITKYELNKKETKRGISYSLMVYIMTNLGMYDIQFWISQSGNADATISGNTYGRLSYSGRLVPIPVSRTFKGHSYP